MTKMVSILVLSILITSCEKNKIIYIADHLADCEGVSAQKCMKVKENLDDDWTFFYDQIEGFDYQEGQAYTIEVAVTKKKNAAADASGLKYKLVKIISQEKNSKLEFSKLSGTWKTTQIANLESLEKQPTLVFENGKISGNSGCNNYGASYKTDGNTIAFGLVMATKMYCTNMKIEKAFFECIQNTTEYQLNNGVLTFYSKEKDILLVCSSIN